ncbi:DUF4245 domain-containing protein [Propionibacteriaceae bacterium G57]|uniref:DUF4245 domain-containing protein n=1 Tax=Aestuariimicrobium sp. G57 TaxID=3418485 RepID=UPI003DA779B6
MAGPNPRAGARDMFLTVAVLMVPVLLITWFFTRDPEQPPIVDVPWQSTVQTAKTEAGFPVQTLVALPAGWRATKATFVKQGEQLPSGNPADAPTLELGFLSDDEMYFAVNQTSSTSSSYRQQVTRDGIKLDPVKVGDVTWDHYQSPNDRTHSLVRTEGGVTTLLVSDAGVDRLVQLAGMLTPA